MKSLREQIENELAYSTGAIKPSGIKSILFAVLDEIERLQAQAHEPVAIPLEEMQKRINSLSRARDAINQTITVHNDHLQAHNTDILRLMNDRAELRDQFAMAALTGLLAHRGVVSPSHPTGEVRFLVEDAYNVADAMLAIRGDKPAFNPQKFIADYSRPHKFDYWKMSGLRHTEYRVCKCGFSEDARIHPKENQDVNDTINGQPKSITIEFAEEETGQVEQTHATPIEENYGGTDPE